MTATARTFVLAVLLAGCSASSSPSWGTGGQAGDDGTGGEGGGQGGRDAGPGPEAAAGGSGGEMGAHDAAVDASPPVADAAADLASADRGLDPGTTDGPALGTDGGTAFVLTSTGFLMKGADLIFPASSSYPMDHSPPFAWSGAPAATKSFALTFIDKSNGATKWVLWDIPATRTDLPADISKSVNPPEVSGSSQRGSLNRTGYSGPGTPALHTYEFVLWALSVDKLPGTNGLSTVDLRTKILPMHAIAMTPALVAKGQQN